MKNKKNEYTAVFNVYFIILQFFICWYVNKNMCESTIICVIIILLVLIWMKLPKVLDMVVIFTLDDGYRYGGSNEMD